MCQSLSHRNKNQQKSGIFVVNQTNCYDLGQELGRIQLKALK
jgi:hypothetical protein